MIFVGYAEQAKAYKLYNPKSRKTIVSRDVEFIEDGLELIHGDLVEELNDEELVTLRSSLTRNEPFHVAAERHPETHEVEPHANEEVDELVETTNEPEAENTGRIVLLSDKEREKYERFHPGANLKTKRKTKN